MNIIVMLNVAVLCILLGYMLATVPESPENTDRKTLWGRIKRPGAKKEKSPRVLAVLVLIVSLIFVRDVIVGSTPFGSTTMGGFLEKGNYRETYYVFAFPEGSEAMNYRVKAEIHSYTRYRGIGPNRVYQLDRIRMPDGGTVTFMEQAGSTYTLKPYELVTVTDDDGRKWRIQLTKDKAP